MKLFTLSSALTVAASSVFAGPIAYSTQNLPESIVDEAGSMGGAGLWLIPLLAFALLFLVVKDGGSGPVVCERTANVETRC